MLLCGRLLHAGFLASVFLLQVLCTSNMQTLKERGHYGACNLTQLSLVQARKEEGTGRQFFIDHNTRKTTWVRPKAQPPSRMDIPPPSSAALGNVPADEAAPGSTAAEQQVDALPAGSSAQPEEFGLFGLGLDEVCY